MEIVIACSGNTLLDINELVELQGNLKNLSEEDYVKLRNSITQYGFSFPIFFWESPDGKKYVIDAHQRLRALKKMRDEGATIPPLPADPIMAKDKKEAKEKLLLLNSRYGKMTDTGLTDYLNEEDSKIEFDQIADFLTFPEITINEEQDEAPHGGQPREIQCPSCGHKFTP